MCERKGECGGEIMREERGKGKGDEGEGKERQVRERL